MAFFPSMRKKAKNVENYESGGSHKIANIINLSIDFK